VINKYQTANYKLAKVSCRSVFSGIRIADGAMPCRATLADGVQAPVFYMSRLKEIPELKSRSEDLEFSYIFPSSFTLMLAYSFETGQHLIQLAFQMSAQTYRYPKADQKN
jgi:hypothetical protein